MAINPARSDASYVCCFEEYGKPTIERGDNLKIKLCCLFSLLFCISIGACACDKSEADTPTPMPIEEVQEKDKSETVKNNSIVLDEAEPLYPTGHVSNRNSEIDALENEIDKIIEQSQVVEK